MVPKLFRCLHFRRCCGVCYFRVVAVVLCVLDVIDVSTFPPLLLSLLLRRCFGLTLFRCLLSPPLLRYLFFSSCCCLCVFGFVAVSTFPPLFRCLHFPRCCGDFFLRVVAMSLRFPLVAVAKSSAWLLFLGRLDLYVYFTT